MYNRAWNQLEATRGDGSASERTPLIPKAGKSRFALPPAYPTDDDNGLRPKDRESEIMSGGCNGRHAFAGGWNKCASCCNGLRIDMRNERPAQLPGSSEVDDEVGEV